MATITEDYVCFETAKLLKEKGFGIKEETRGYYPIKGDANGRLMFGAEYHHNTSQVQIAAPTLQMTTKWLRLEHNILLFLLPAQENGKLVYLVEVWNWNEEEGIYESTYAPMPRKEPEEAIQAAIKYCLANLI